MRSVIVKEGEEYLPSISLEDLEKMQRREPPSKARTILQAAVLRKQGKTITTIRKCIGFAESTIHRWLARLASDGLERRYDKKSPGRPPLINQEQQNAIAEHLDKEPQESGFSRGNWTARMVARLIRSTFNVSYTDDGALKLAYRLGFSVRKSGNYILE